MSASVETERTDLTNGSLFHRNVSVTVIPILVLLLISGCTTSHQEPTGSERKLAVAFQKEPGECITRAWLMEEVSDSAIASGSRATPDVLRMVRNRQVGDKIFFYKSPPETWAALLGRSGFAIIRDGKPVVCVDTVVN